MGYHGYTINEMVAMAEARGCSYGVIQSALEFGAPMPKLKKSVKWPKGSDHRGEQQLDANGVECYVQVTLEEPEAPPVPKPKKAKAKNDTCTACGLVADPDIMTILTQRTGDRRNPHYHKVGVVCPDCIRQLLPPALPGKREKFPLVDEAGNKINSRVMARCSRCGGTHVRHQGGQIYMENHAMPHKHIAAYLCPSCLPGWLDEAKTGTPL